MKRVYKVENSSSAEFSSADEKVKARFQVPRQSLDCRGIPNRSATSTKLVPSRRPTIGDRTTTQYKGALAGAPVEEDEIIIPKMQEAKTQPISFIKIYLFTT